MIETNQIKVTPLRSKQIQKYSYKAFQIFYLGIILLLTYTPILVMVLTSFSTDPLGYRMNGLTTKWYTAMFTNDDLKDAIIFTLEITFLSTLISTIFGTFTAIGINSLSKELKKKFIVLNNVPILNADIVTAVFLLLKTTCIKSSLILPKTE